MAECQPGVVRRHIEVRGLVQGVGFRPFAHRLAHELGLTGWVRNHSEGVSLELEGPAARIDDYLTRLPAELPAPGLVDTVTTEDLAPLGTPDFTIELSEHQGGAVALILPDLAICDACRNELFDPTNRRFGYPFTNCTHCGPRFTIIRDVPYDRVHTTMREFVLCDDCATEYHDPAERRFHAQPNACPSCGPRLTLHDAAGAPLSEPDPLPTAVALLRQGKLLALKGLGGYHLACDARRPEVVDELRRRKHRDAKPLAIMVRDLAQARQVALVSTAEASWLSSPAAPIVLLTQRPDRGLAPALAPGLTTVGVMLPYTPLHHLLLAAFGSPLVMTSGNLSDEPIAHLDEDALTRLHELADGFLMHDRPIQRRCDDSVVKLRDDQPIFFRRSRGYAPAPIALDDTAAGVVLAVGGHQKNTFCLTRAREAFLSHHVGDLENDLALAAFETGIADFERLFDLPPTVIAHDQHPDYLATQYAVARASRDGLPIIAVQHHHAHLAACLADCGRHDEVIGLALDGTGWGPDGTVWGGEVLLCDRADYRRVGRLRPFALAGGEAAVRQGWRVALALAHQAEVDYTPTSVEPRRVDAARQMLRSGFRCLTTSSAGRLFDGFSALCGVAEVSRYEGEAAIWLEGLAASDAGPLPFGQGTADGLHELDWRPAVRAVVGRTDGLAALATAFHRGLAEGLAELCQVVRDESGRNVVALSGGCLQNVRLLGLLSEALRQAGFEVLCHRRVPPNDGGLALGQAVVARARQRG